jgi:ATP-dependent Clp protease ATP-binding subunit ClpC
MQEEAQRFEHGYMGTEHLMLGLLRDVRSQASRVLVNLGAEPSGLKSQLEGIIGRRGSLYTGGTGMTRRCQRVIESAARIARTSGQRTVGTGHLLHALVEQPEDVAGQLLEGSGITTDRVAAELRHMGPESE